MPNQNEPLFIEITYPIDQPDKFTITGTIKSEKHADIIADFLQLQVGKGADDSPAKELAVYHIRIELELENDTFKSSSDTGNKGLRDGILMDVLSRLPE